MLSFLYFFARGDNAKKMQMEKRKTTREIILKTKNKKQKTKNKKINDIIGKTMLDFLHHWAQTAKQRITTFAIKILPRWIDAKYATAVILLVGFLILIGLHAGLTGHS